MTNAPNASAVDGHDDLSPLNFQCPNGRIVRPQTLRFEGDGMHGGRYSCDGNIVSLIGKSPLSVVQRTKGGGGLGEQIKRCRRDAFGHAEQSETGMKAFAFFDTFLFVAKSRETSLISLPPRKRMLMFRHPLMMKGDFSSKIRSSFF